MIKFSRHLQKSNHVKMLSWLHQKLGSVVKRSLLMLLFNIVGFYEQTKKRSAILRNNRNYLIENIDPSDELISSLLSLKCIAEEQSDFIQRQRSKRDKNAELLNFLRSFDQQTSSNFIKCLRRNNQKTVGRVIENGGGSRQEKLCFKTYSTRISVMVELIVEVRLQMPVKLIRPQWVCCGWHDFLLQRLFCHHSYGLLSHTKPWNGQGFPLPQSVFSNHNWFSQI